VRKLLLLRLLLQTALLQRFRP
jgi:hypothetical protein